MSTYPITNKKRRHSGDTSFDLHSRMPKMLRNIIESDSYMQLFMFADVMLFANEVTNFILIVIL